MPKSQKFKMMLILLAFSLAYANVPNEELFPFGVGIGDSIAPPIDDAFAGPIQLNRAFPFFNITYENLFVDNNGAISFAQGLADYTPECGALPARLSMIAPFWSDVDTGQGRGGTVYYRESNDPLLRTKAADEITDAFPEMWSITVSNLFISTWYDVTFYGANQQCGHTNSSAPRNTFQIVLATDGVHSFAIFYYANITWTTGRASKGDCQGLGGNPAKAGFDVGDGKTFYEIPGSCTREISNISESSNLGYPGKWIFRVDNSFVSASCDNDESSKLQISPSFVTIFGQIPLTIKGPCFNDSYQAACVFHDGSKLVRSRAFLRVRQGVPEALCQVPYLYTQGKLRIELNLQYGVLYRNYTGYIYVTQMEDDVKADISKLADQWSVRLSWDPKLYPSPAGVLQLKLLDFNVRAFEWTEMTALAEDIPNNGHYELVTPLNISSFGVFSLTMSISYGRQSPVIFQISKSSKFVYKIYEEPSECENWYSKDLGVPDDILACPPTLQQALHDERFEMDTRFQDGQAGWPFHVGAEFGFRQRVSTPSGAGQQCMYIRDNSDGRLFLGPPGGGRPDTVSPNSLTGYFQHQIQDVLPWFMCCGPIIFDKESCYKFYEKRPSNTGDKYSPPRPAQGAGDPHLITFDFASYTFNGMGEFWMIKATNGSEFSMQARMQQFLEANGDSIRASVFTAFVLRNEEIQIQVQLALNSINVLLNGNPIDFGPDKIQKQVLLDSASITVSPDWNRVTAVFSNGFTFVFTKSDNSLTLLAMADEKNRGKTKGLLGVYNGDPSDDLQAPDGIVISPNSSMESIHYDFGMKWMIRKDESFFTYGKDQGYETFKNETFRPNFASPDLQEMPSEIIELCQSDFACLYDYSMTNSSIFANLTRTAMKKFNETVENFSTDTPMCPGLRNPQNGYVNLNSTWVGAIAEFGCYANYTLIGHTRIICTEDRNWSGDAPVCESIIDTTISVSTSESISISSKITAETTAISTSQSKTGHSEEMTSTSIVPITSRALKSWPVIWLILLCILSII